MRRVHVISGEAARATLVIARSCGVDRSAAAALAKRLGVLPRAFENAEALALVESLMQAGVRAEVIDGPPTASARCTSHPSLERADSCERCGNGVCVVCLLAADRPACAACLAKQKRQLAFRNARVVALVVLMLGVIAWGLGRQLRNDRRTRWERPLTVSIVLVSQAPAGDAAVSKWNDAGERLTEWFEREWKRRRPLGMPAPVQFVLEQAVTVAVLPEAPKDTRSAVEFGRALDAIDASAHVRHNDATVYVVLSSAASQAQRVEGIGEAGGRRGLVYAEANAADLTLETVALAHELLHCLGATDKYDADGHAVVPAGLVAPQQVPLYPQPAGEVMAGEVATSESGGRAIRTLLEAQIGPATARELHW